MSSSHEPLASSHFMVDYSFCQSLSPIAREACEIVARIREEEQLTIWTDDFEAHLAADNPGNVFPGMMFSLAKERMEQTKLWHIIRRMPKGALLHAHFDAMVDLDFLFKKLLETPGMCIACECDLSSPEMLEKGNIMFRYRKAEGTRSSIWTASYENNAFVSVVRAADDFPQGGRAGFLKWLRWRLTITHNESLQHHLGVDMVWKKFTTTFGILGGIIFYEPIFRPFVQRMLRLLLADGIKWVDLRLAFMWRWYQEGNEKPHGDYFEMFRIFGEEIRKFKASEEGKGFWGARIIWTTIRAMDTRHVVEDMDNCIAMKIAFPHLISGYDLVGQEDKGRPLKGLLPELFWFRQQCSLSDVEIPFFFHAGECLGDGNDTDQNLYDAILLGTRRIGHGFSLYKHPILIDLVKEKKILVESCPISNEILRLCAGIMSHPLPALLARGVPCALCNDDPAILGQDTSGMTHDFWQALQGWDNLGLAGLGSLAENSVRWAIFEDQTKSEWDRGIKEASLGRGVRAERMKEWAVEWEEFCLWIVTEFGDESRGA